MKTSGIYLIRHRESGKCYVGSSVNCESRFYQHKSLLRLGRHRNPILQAAWNKYGPDAFDFELLESVPVETLIAREQWHMDQRQPNVFNVGTAVDCPVRGQRRKASPSHHAALIVANRKRVGWRHTDTVKAILSAANKGRKRSQEHRDAIRRAQMGNTHRLGKTLPPEIVARIAAKNTGRKNTPETIAKMKAARQAYLQRVRTEAANA